MKEKKKRPKKIFSSEHNVIDLNEMNQNNGETFSHDNLVHGSSNLGKVLNHSQILK